jgi:hypothetical protein
LQINVAAVGVGVQAGSPVRFLKRVKYGLYKAGDGKWYLGFDFVTGDGATWSPQPVSGPYRAHYAALDARNGLRIRCYHRNGTELGLDVCATSDSLNRLDFTFRSETNAAVAKTGLGTTETLVDSMTVRVALRNNS